jgi:mannose-6-phosphate isomerase-like protein (cupin superfamily)
MEKIVIEKEFYAIILRQDYSEKGINFFTDDDQEIQLAHMKHPEGKKIQPHVHHKIKRDILYTSEVIILKKGILRVDFYDVARNKVRSEYLYQGDLIVLFKGGHGFEVIEDVEMLEIKQGPYLGELDKEKF